MDPLLIVFTVVGFTIGLIGAVSTIWMLRRKRHQCPPASHSLPSVYGLAPSASHPLPCVSVQSGKSNQMRPDNFSDNALASPASALFLDKSTGCKSPIYKPKRASTSGRNGLGKKFYGNCIHGYNPGKQDGSNQLVVGFLGTGKGKTSHLDWV